MILTVLKIIGFILLIILVLIIFILGVVIFSPVKYSFDGEYFENIQANAKISWFPIFLKAFVFFRDGELVYTVHMFGGVVMTNTDAKLSWIGRRFFNFDKEDDISEKGKNKEASHDQTAHFSDSNDIVKPIDNIERKDLDDSGHMESVASGKKRQSLFERLRDAICKIRSKIRAWIDKLKEINKKKDALSNLFHSKRFEVAKADVIQYIKELLNILKPKYLEGNICFGMEDPATTGQILGGLAMILPLYDEFLTVCPDFEHACLEGRLKGDGSIRLFPIVKLVFKVIFNKNLIKVTKKVQTIMEN